MFIKVLERINLCVTEENRGQKLKWLTIRLLSLIQQKIRVSGMKLLATIILYMLK